MKKILFLAGSVGLLLTGCSSSSRLGYAHFDDVYEDRPFYVDDKRTNQNDYQPPVYQEQRYEQVEQGNYQDDEAAYGSYSDRINRFHRNSGNFDYYSPFSTGFNSGFNSGFNMGINYGMGFGSGFGYGMNFGWGNTWGNPWYSSGINIGWGWNNPFCNNWGWNRPFYDPFWNPWSWNRPIGGWGGWNNPWGSPWGWGNTVIINNYYDNNQNRNLYYGPRGSNFNNSYYQGGLGGRSNSVGNTPGNISNPRPTTAPGSPGIQMNRYDKPGNGLTPVNPSPSVPNTPGRTTPDRGNTPSQPMNPGLSPAPSRPSNTPNNMNRTPKSDLQPSAPSVPPAQPVNKFRYSTPKAPSNNSYQSPGRNVTPSYPSRPSYSAPSAPSRPSPSYSPSPGRSTPSSPSRNAPSGSPGMQRTPK